MGIITLIKFRFTCDNCASESDFLAQSRTPKYHSPDRVRSDGRDDFYQIGDVMEWHDDAESEMDWPSDYAFVSRLQGYAVYVIEKCWGQCPACRSCYNFYFYIKDRQIMRLIGHESADLNYNSIVTRDPVASAPMRSCEGL